MGSLSIIKNQILSKFLMTLPMEDSEIDFKPFSLQYLSKRGFRFSFPNLGYICLISLIKLVISGGIVDCLTLYGLIERGIKAVRLPPPSLSLFLYLLITFLSTPNASLVTFLPYSS
jgi:hypothetical protein